MENNLNIYLWNQNLTRSYKSSVSSKTLLKIKIPKTLSKS